MFGHEEIYYDSLRKCKVTSINESKVFFLIYKLNLKMDLKLGVKYKMSKKLGSGAFGEVFLAKELATWEEVAVKVELNRTRHPLLICNTYLEKKWISKSKLAIVFSNKRNAKNGQGCIQDESS